MGARPAGDEGAGWEDSAVSEQPVRPDVAALGAFLGVLEAKPGASLGVPGEREPFPGEAAARVRAEHCPACRFAGDESPAELDASCAALRCHLRRPEAWLDEDLFLRFAVGTFLLGDHPPTPEDEGLLLSHLVRVGAAVFCALPMEGGRFVPGYAPVSLCGLVHGGLVLAITHRFGDVSVPPDTLTAAEAKAVVGGRRSTRAEMRTRQQQREAAMLRDQGVSDRQIARRLSRSRGTLRNWLGKAEDWPRASEEWWRKHRG